MIPPAEPATYQELKAQRDEYYQIAKLFYQHSGNLYNIIEAIGYNRPPSEEERAQSRARLRGSLPTNGASRIAKRIANFDKRRSKLEQSLVACADERIRYRKEQADVLVYDAEFKESDVKKARAFIVREQRKSLMQRSRQQLAEMKQQDDHEEIIAEYSFAVPEPQLPRPQPAPIQFAPAFAPAEPRTPAIPPSPAVPQSPAQPQQAFFTPLAVPAPSTPAPMSFESLSLYGVDEEREPEDSEDLQHTERDDEKESEPAETEADRLFTTDHPADAGHHDLEAERPLKRSPKRRRVDDVD